MGTNKQKPTRKEVCDMIMKDIEDDAANFDGKPFTGKTMAEYMGYHGAAIVSLANLVKSLLEEIEELKEDNKELSLEERSKLGECPTCGRGDLD